MARTAAAKTVPQKSRPTAATKPGALAPGGIKKPHRWRNGTVALREIRKYQKSPELLLLKMPFQRLVRDIAMRMADGVRFKASSVAALQFGAESAIVDYLEEALLYAIHARRVSVMGKDAVLVNSVRARKQK